MDKQKISSIKKNQYRGVLKYLFLKFDFFIQRKFLNIISTTMDYLNIFPANNG